MRLLTFGLTPAFQRIMLFDELRPNQVNRAAEVVCCISGKSTNTAIGVESLDRTGQSVLLTPLAGPLEGTMKSELAALGVRLRNLPTQAPTRTCTTLIDRKNRTHTELVENGLPMSVEELGQAAQIFQEEARQTEMLILTGSLPLGCPKDFYKRLLDSLDAPVPFLCDFRGEELLHVLPHKPLFVKPNREELGATLGRTLGTPEETREAMLELNRLGAQWVVVTDGSRAAFLSGQGEFHRLTPIPCEPSQIVNPIGCGDAMSAAIAWAYCSGEEALSAVKQGLAAAYLNLQSVLPCRLAPERVRELALAF